MEDMILKYLADKLPIMGAFAFIAYYMIKSQLAQLRRDIEEIEKKRVACETSCRTKIESYNTDMRHLEASMTKGFEEVKIAIAEIKTELKLKKETD